MKKILTILLMLLMSFVLFAQIDSLLIYTEPIENNFNINVKFEIEKNGEIFNYKYKIVNLQNSVQAIASFDVVHKAYMISNDDPVNWWSVLDNDTKEMSWFADVVESEINPGDSLNNFNFTANSLPSINTFISAADVPVPELPREPDSIVLAGGTSILDNSVLGKTIAPDSSLFSVSNAAFCDTLISFVEQSLEFGWLDPSVSDYYKESFSLIKNGIQQTETDITVKGLQKIIITTEQQKGNKLTNEAHSLLYYNSKYLLEKISSDL